MSALFEKVAVLKVLINFDLQNVTKSITCCVTFSCVFSARPFMLYFHVLLRKSAPKRPRRETQMGATCVLEFASGDDLFVLSRPWDPMASERRSKAPAGATKTLKWHQNDTTSSHFWGRQWRHEGIFGGGSDAMNDANLPSCCMVITNET